MSSIVIIDNDYVTLWYHPEQKIVHHQFHKAMFGEPFRETLNKGLEIFQQYGAQKWLSDDRNNAALHPDDSCWALTDWFPRVKAAGWKYWAIVMPEDIFGKMNMKRFMQDYAEYGIVARPFGDPDEAFQWLESQGQIEPQPEDQAVE